MSTTCETSQKLHNAYYDTVRPSPPLSHPSFPRGENTLSNAVSSPQAFIRAPVKVQWSVENVLSRMPHRPTHDTTSPVPFFHLIERLKTTKRTGWTNVGIEDGESVSDHMYRMAILAMVAPTTIASRIDISRCVQMALIHDMAESIVGDITPVEGVSKAEKSRRESEAMDYISERLLGHVPGLSGQRIREIWQEYEDDETTNAHFVHDLDKIEHVLQMVEYERKHEGQKDLGEFTWICSRIKLPEVKEWCDAVLEERKQFWRSFDKEPQWRDEPRFQK